MKIIPIILTVFVIFAIIGLISSIVQVFYIHKDKKKTEELIESQNDDEIDLFV